MPVHVQMQENLESYVWVVDAGVSTRQEAPSGGLLQQHGHCCWSYEGLGTMSLPHGQCTLRFVTSM